MRLLNRAGRGMTLVIVVTALITLGVAALLVNIFERKQEAREPFFRVVEIDDTTTDPAIWGQNFPLQYDLWKQTVDMVYTRYGGSEAMLHVPSGTDPREVVSQSKIEEDPRLARMWAGYAFATDFREERGHAYMLIDQTYTRRVTEFKQPGTCINCHASTYVAYKELGEGDIFAGFAKINQMTYAEARKHVEHPVSCIDCHDAETMQLRVTRPAFMEGMRALKASQGVEDYDVNEMASAQEMRIYVCGQCHVEYYFKGEEKRLTYPWFNGLKVDGIYDYYQAEDFADWTHKDSGARVLKAQHPEFEMFNQGVHARSGVTCPDCHMPYRRAGGLKVSDHQVRSPLLNVNRACQGCHHFSEQEIADRVEEIQGRYFTARDLALDALMDLIDDIAAARAQGADDASLAEARSRQRQAQFYLDFVEAENSTGFHAPGESLRILTESVNLSRLGQIELRDAGVHTAARSD